MLVAERRTQDPGVMRANLSRSWGARVERNFRRLEVQWSASRYLSSKPAGTTFFSDDRTEYASGLVPQLPDCDVVNLHSVAGLVDYPTFFPALPPRLPLVWTLHDPNPFTGGCHNHGACPGCRHECGHCPVLGSTQEKDLSRAIWRRKKRAYSYIPEGRLHVVAPSRWLAAECRQSVLLGRFPVSVIPNGLDTTDFRPRDRAVAREVLGIKRDSKVVMFVAGNIGDPNKGLSLLLEALAPSPANGGIHLLSVGRGSDFPGVRLPRTNVGFIEGDRVLSWIYSAADIYVTPTLMDNLPNIVMESMSCGTPVIGFEVGGVPEMVHDGVSGFLVPKGDVAGLRQAILRVLNNPTLRAEMSENCRRIAVQVYDEKVQARRYLALYESVLGIDPWGDDSNLHVNAGHGDSRESMVDSPQSTVVEV
jgi:glycosyltransferase involved in cell wall biosynthesis